MRSHLVRLHSAHVSYAAAPIFLGIAVEQLPPVSATRYANAVAGPRDGCKVSHDENQVIRGRSFTQERQDTGGRVAAIHPFKASGIGIERMQSRFAAIVPIQHFYPLLYAAVQRSLH